jgi:hypothetical protein
MAIGTRDALDEQDGRIVGWLLAYPASAAVELAAALSIHPTTAYRALARMRQAHLVTPLTGYGGEARWLLTRAGTTILAQGLHMQADALAAIWQRGMNAPAHLMPRLATIDRFHIFARGFFQHAPVQLAERGHAARVRWHIVRDWRERVDDGGNRQFTTQAHALLVWTVEDSRISDLSAWALASLSLPIQRWEAAFVLVESGLCDADLMRVKLRRLSGLRASLARGKESTSGFPSVLNPGRERTTGRGVATARAAGCAGCSHLAAVWRYRGRGNHHRPLALGMARSRDGRKYPSRRDVRLTT